MATLLRAVVALALVASPALAQKKPEPKPLTPVERADALYAKRADLDRAREAIGVLREAAKASPSDYEVAWRTAKACYYLAAHTTDAKERVATFKEGIEAGKAAVKLRPERPEGHFWLGAAIGGRVRAEGTSGFGALNAAGDVRDQMEAVIKIDPSFQGGSAYLALGEIDLRVPGLLGGSKKRAVERLEQGLKYGPGNAFLRVRLAEAYLGVGRKDDAKRQIDYVLAMKPDADYLPEYREAAAEAKALRDKNR